MKNLDFYKTKAHKLVSSLCYAVIIAIAITGFNSCKKNSNNGTVPDSVIPSEIRDKISDKMPIYSGTTPPDISGQYLWNSLVLISSSFVGDSIYYSQGGGKWADLYMAFIKESGKLTYHEQQTQASGSSDSVTVAVAVVGSGENFTAYFVKTGVCYGISTTQSTVISGTMTPNGLENCYYAFIMLKKGDDPTPLLVPVNTYRIFHEDNSVAANYIWYSAGTQSVQQPSPKVFSNGGSSRLNIYQGVN